MERDKTIRRYLQENLDYLKSRDLIAEKLAGRTNISIVVPVYNEKLCLPRLLRALNLQTYHNFEVILVDNGSTDETVNVARSWQSKTDYPLYITTEPNKGAANARKRGMDEVLLRVAERESSFPFHLIVTTDADTIPPFAWLEKIYLRAKDFSSPALAGTHQAAEEVDFTINQRLGIKDYFNFIPSLIESLRENHIGLIKMSGPNAAFEIEAYAAAGGMRQEYDEKTGRVKLNEVNSLGRRIRQLGYPIIPMGIRVITSKRRQFKELLDGSNSYFPNDYSEKERFNVVREEEYGLLMLALEKVDKNLWLQYRGKMVNTVLNNLIFTPFLVGEIPMIALPGFFDLIQGDQDEERLKLPIILGKT